MTDPITAEMVEAIHDADISGGIHGRYQRMIAAVWPLIAAAAWRDGYAQGRDDEASGLPLRDAP
jgi:hypothetical protein